MVSKASLGCLMTLSHTLSSFTYPRGWLLNSPSRHFGCTRVKVSIVSPCMNFVSRRIIRFDCNIYTSIIIKFYNSSIISGMKGAHPLLKLSIRDKGQHLPGWWNWSLLLFLWPLIRVIISLKPYNPRYLFCPLSKLPIRDKIQPLPGWCNWSTLPLL